MAVHTQNDQHPADRRKPSLLKKIFIAGAVVVALVLACILILLAFPDPLLNRFVKPMITQAFAEAYPTISLRIGTLSYSVVRNRLRCDSIAVSAADSTFSASLGSFAISGIDWMHLLRGERFSEKDFENAVVDANTLALSFPQSDYGVRCGQLHVSVRDSAIDAEAVEIQSLSGDEAFFRRSGFRQTRMHLVIPLSSARGVAFPELVEGKMYRTRSVELRDPFLEILVNKDKFGDRRAPRLRMPAELLGSISANLRVEQLSVANGTLRYGERFAVGAHPAWISFDSMQAVVEGIATPGGPGAAVVVHFQGTFMKAGTMNVRMSVPFASPDFSFQYSGSLSRMDVRALNPFLETAEQTRIKSGVIQTAHFEIAVTSGQARGAVRVIYRDLMFAVIDKRTRREDGFADHMASFIARTFTIRGTNEPDRSGAIKVGKVNYTRKQDDPFFGFAWFALRSGLRDVVGF